MITFDNFESSINAFTVVVFPVPKLDLIKLRTPFCGKGAGIDKYPSSLAGTLEIFTKCNFSFDNFARLDKIS